jgi:hypothetical protein
MAAYTERRSSQAGTGTARLCPSEFRLSPQTLLAALAELDVEYEGDLEKVRKSSADDWLKQIVIRTLQERYLQQQASYIRQAKDRAIN